MRLWLASGSPRRRDLLERVGFTLDVHPGDIDESRIEGDSPVEHARRLASGKADTGPFERVVIAADTVVHLEDEVLDKPTHRDQARQHLLALSGQWHDVTTGVCLRYASERRLFHVTTRVRFRALPTWEIDAYLATGEADDKAGAYGIQGLGGALVADVRGSWTNVMGLPLEETLAGLLSLGIQPRTSA